MVARKIFKSILWPVRLLYPRYFSLPATIARFPLLSHCAGRRDHWQGQHPTSEENHDNPPSVVRKIWCARKTERERETIVTCARGVQRVGYEWPDGGRMIPSRNVLAVAQTPIVKSIPSRRDLVFRGERTWGVSEYRSRTCEIAFAGPSAGDNRRSRAYLSRVATLCNRTIKQIVLKISKNLFSERPGR